MADLRKWAVEATGLVGAVAALTDPSTLEIRYQSRVRSWTVPDLEGKFETTVRELAEGIGQEFDQQG